MRKWSKLNLNYFIEQQSSRVGMGGIMNIRKKKKLDSWDYFIIIFCFVSLIFKCHLNTKFGRLEERRILDKIVRKKFFKNKHLLWIIWSISFIYLFFWQVIFYTTFMNLPLSIKFHLKLIFIYNISVNVFFINLLIRWYCIYMWLIVH